MIPHKKSPDAIVMDVMKEEEAALGRLLNTAIVAARLLEQNNNPEVAGDLRKAVADIKALQVIHEPAFKQ